MRVSAVQAAIAVLCALVLGTAAGWLFCWFAKAAARRLLCQ